MDRRLVLSALAALSVLTASPAGAAIAVDVTTSADGTAASSTITSPAFSTVAANELVLAFVATDAAAGTTASVTAVSGAGLTWTLVVRSNAESGASEIWRAFAPAPVTGANVSATLSQAAVAAITVMSFTGVDTSGTGGAGAIGAVNKASAAAGAPSASLAATRAGSWIVGVGNDWDSAVPRTAAAGQSIVHQTMSVTGDTYWVQKQDAASTSVGSTMTISDTAPTSDRYNLAICEILPAAAAAKWSVSGVVSPAANGAGTTIAVAGGVTATADASGAFTVAGLANGSYTLAPSKAGYTFTPSSQVVNVNGANVTSVNFTAQPIAAPSPVRLVQRAVAGSEAAVLQIAATFPAANVAGNFLVVAGAAARPAGTITITDSAGNTYVPAIGPVSDPAQDVTAYIWYVPRARGGANTVTLKAAAARALEIHVSEWTGINATTPVDRTAFATGSGTVASSAVTTTAGGDLVYGYGFVANSATAGAGFTALSPINGDVDEYVVQTAAGSIAPSFTQTSGAWLALTAAFKAAAGSTDTTPPVVSMSAPASGNVSGTTTLAATATDNVGVVGVQFKVDGVNAGAEVTAQPYAVSWATTSVGDGAHTIVAVARDAAGNVATSAPLNVTVANVAASMGQWSAPFDLGLVAVNAVLMHTGKVLLFSGSYVSGWTERVWDPATGTATLVPNPFSNLFCSGQAQLPDGRILIVGGFDTSSLGAANANIFDPVSASWSAAPNMAYRRWYPTATALPDGRMLVTSGGQTCLTCIADLPEIFDPSTGHFSTLTTARLAVPYYPFMFVLPDGSVLDAGANEEVVATSRLNLSSGTWSTVDPVVRDGHSAVMYAPGKILKSGTAADSGTTGNAAATAFTLDMTQPSPAWKQVASMAFPRAFHNTTMLPDGSVLVTGGGTTLDGHDVTRAVYAAETWTPATGAWRTLASASVPRLYHSTALLLPDGRVLSAGGGNDTGAVNETQGQIFSPPYLFKGARPSIASVADAVQYGAAFSINTPDAATISSVVLMRPGAVTHGFDEDQRYVPLPFTAQAGALTATAPANANLAPPGYYMLFLVNTTGVPSIASFVRLGTATVDTVPPTPPGNLVAQAATGVVNLTWSAATDDSGVALYNVYRSTTAPFQPSAATKVGQATTTQFTDTVRAGTYFYVVTAQDVAQNVSAPSNEATAIVVGDATPPTVSITSPANQATVSGTATVTATAADDVGVAGVQFQLDGAPIGAERVAPPYSVAWNTTTTSNGPHNVAAVARDAAGNRTTASIAVSVANASSAHPGLVAAFGFNEGTGVQTKDASGQGNTGTLSNATWTTSGKFGSALSFNGTSAWVTVADAASLQLTAGMTLEAWVRPSSGTGWRSAILKETPSGLAWALYTANNASRPVGYAHVGTDVPVTGTDAVPVNTWTHVAVTYDGAALRLYTNGTLVSSTDLTGPMTIGGGPLRIGGNAIWGEYFKGLIDEVRVYNRALSAAEIQIDMTTPIN